MSRIDSATRIIAADPETVYAALIDPKAMSKWRPPEGMHGEVLGFDLQPGGKLRMALHYDDPSIAGKSSGGTDIFESTFVALEPGRKVVEDVVFESDDSAFSGTMTVTTTLEPIEGGTEVTITCSNVPSGIGEADHLAGLNSTLANLADYCEHDD